MTVDPIERLRAANPEPWCPAPSIDEVWRRIEASAHRAPDRLVARRRGTAGLGGRLRSTIGGVIALSSVLVAIAIGAVVLLGHGRGTPPGGGRDAQQLIAQLAVLRRPQTAADRLPTRPRIRDPQGTIIPQLTRLVRVLPDARLFLIVTKPNAHSNPIWSPQLGYQAAIVEIAAAHATQTSPIPAADLTDATDVSLISAAPPAPYSVAIVPDGVARVRWTFLSNQSQSAATVEVPVSENVAVSRARHGASPPVARATWYAPDGRRIATSNRAQLAGQAARDAKLKAQAIRFILKHPYHADPALLSSFAVFAITSPTGVTTATGNIISHPPLSAFPFDVLLLGTEPGPRFQLDFTQARQVITPSGARLYIIPGKQGLCLSATSPSPSPGRALGGAGGASCNDLAHVESQGIYMTAGSLGIDTTYRILPKTIQQITIHTSSGARTIAVPDGIYVSPSQRTGK